MDRLEILYFEGSPGRCQLARGLTLRLVNYTTRLRKGVSVIDLEVIRSIYLYLFLRAHGWWTGTAANREGLELSRV
jgi:hypothetical protein